MIGVKSVSSYRIRYSAKSNLSSSYPEYFPLTIFILRFATDLVEAYFEICHTRIALIGPARFRAQFNASFPPATPDATSSPSSVTLHQLPSKQNTVHPAILAAVLAWGAKFSDHPLIEIDRNADPSGAQRSRLAKSLIRKAWEIAEAEKVHCVPSVDSVVTCLLLDGLHSREFQHIHFGISLTDI